MIELRKLSLLLLCIFLFIGANAQRKLTRYGVEDGLPCPEVYFLYQDSDGYIWACTERGVARYNGYEFEVFTSEDGFTHNTVFRVFEDKKKNLYFTCNDGSITVYDHKLKQFLPFWANADIRKKLKGKGWISFIGFDGDDVYLHPVKRSGSDLKFRFKTSWEKSKFVTEQITKEKVYDYDNLVNVITGFYGNENVTNILAVKGSPEMVEFYKENYKDYLNNRSIHIGKQEILYVNSDGIYTQTRTDSSFYPLKGVTAAITDKEGNLWFSTEHDGISKLPFSPFSVYKSEHFLENGDLLWTIGGGGEDWFFLGTKMGYVYEYNIKKNLASNIGTINLTPTSAKTVISICNLGGKFHATLAFKILSSGVSHKLCQTDYFEYVWARQCSSGKVIASDGNSIFYFDNYRGLKMSSSDDISKSDKSKYGNGIAQKIVVKGTLTSIAVLKNETVYFSTMGGFYKIDSSYGILNLTEKYNLTDMPIKKLHSSNNTLVLISDRGIILIKDEERRSITVKDGLPSNLINDGWLAKDGNIWCSTVKGISRINFSKKSNISSEVSIDNFSEENGLDATYIKRFHLQGKMIYALSNKGIISFSEDISLPHRPLPKVHLLKWTQGKRQFSFDNQTFSNDENNMKIEYLGIAMQQPLGRPFYRYKLIKDNGNADWVYTNNRSVELNQLASGAYTFNITARNINDQWAKPKQCNFVIQPHWTAMWWVRSVFLAVSLGGLYLFYRRDRRKRIEKHEKELAVVQLKEKLNSTELAFLRGQMNPHFVHNSLNSIQYFVQQNEVELSEQYLAKFSKLIRLFFEYSEQQTISISSEIELLDLYLGIEQLRFENMTYSIDVDVNMDREDQFIPSMIIQPIVENAVNHGVFHRENNGSIQIDFECNNPDTFSVTIRDNGIGILKSKEKLKESTESYRSHSTGIIKRRLNLLKENKNWDVTYTIKDLGDDKDSSGTLVQLQFKQIHD